ncbi:MAG: glycoside hydrolase family 5 protein [Lachnotalea sp.]
MSNKYRVMRDISAAELESEMTVGWNLGNTFDAYGGGANDETYWGNPRTTQAMIDAIKEKGFNTIRIPVTFAEHVGNGPDYTIDTNWISRVKEVVDYAFADDMYVILDTHHDVNYWLKPTENKVVEAEFTAIWTQDADYFMDYGDHLLFEGMNEVRTIGSSAEWNGGTAEERVAINMLNSDFVSAVRATGGNNEKRCLIISPYGHAALENAIADLIIPSDDNHIMVAIHAYTPYAFTYHSGYDWEKYTWEGSLKSEIENVMKLANTYFVSKGIPVIITEFGAVSKQITNSDGTTIQNTSEVISWLNDYLYYANQYGIKCVWWDNGYYAEQNPSGEVFGIFNRYNLTWYQQDVTDAIIGFANGE